MSGNYDLKHEINMAGKGNKTCEMIKLICIIVAAILTVVAAIVVIALVAKNNDRLSEVTVEIAKLQREVAALQQLGQPRQLPVVATVMPFDNHGNERDMNTTETLEDIKYEIKRVQSLLRKSSKQSTNGVDDIETAVHSIGDLTAVLENVNILSRDVSGLQDILLDKYENLSENISKSVRESGRLDKVSRKSKQKDAYNSKVHMNTKFNRLQTELAARFDVTSAQINDTREYLGRATTNRREQIEASDAFVNDALNRMTSYIIEELQIKMDAMGAGLGDVVTATCEKKRRKSLGVPPN